MPLAGADDLDRPAGRRAEPAIIHLEVFALKVGAPGLPELLHDLHVLSAVVIALGEILVAGPQSHLGILSGVQARDDVDAEPAAGDAVDGDRHAGDDRRRDGQHRDRRV
jgi:hypothetical protein